MAQERPADAPTTPVEESVFKDVPISGIRLSDWLHCKAVGLDP